MELIQYQGQGYYIHLQTASQPASQPSSETLRLIIAHNVADTRLREADTWLREADTRLREGYCEGNGGAGDIDYLINNK